MLLDVGRLDALLSQAASAAQGEQPKRAVAAVDQALGLARRIRSERNAAYQDAVAAWYKSWHPRVAEANGRKFLHQLDDVKDHLPDRTVDMSYLVYRELLLPFGDWVDQVRDARNHYAQAHKLPARKSKFDWKDLSRDAGDSAPAPDDDDDGQ
jgi:hypothetical protein